MVNYEQALSSAGIAMHTKKSTVGENFYSEKSAFYHRIHYVDTLILLSVNDEGGEKR